MECNETRTRTKRHAAFEPRCTVSTSFSALRPIRASRTRRRNHAGGQVSTLTTHTVLERAAFELRRATRIVRVLLSILGLNSRSKARSRGPIDVQF